MEDFIPHSLNFCNYLKVDLKNDEWVMCHQVEEKDNDKEEVLEPKEELCYTFSHLSSLLSI